MLKLKKSEQFIDFSMGSQYLKELMFCGALRAILSAYHSEWGGIIPSFGVLKHLKPDNRPSVTSTTNTYPLVCI